MGRPLAFAGMAETAGSAARNVTAAIRSRPTSSIRSWSAHTSRETMRLGFGVAPALVDAVPWAQAKVANNAAHVASIAANTKIERGGSSRTPVVLRYFCFNKMPYLAQLPP